MPNIRVAASSAAVAPLTWSQRATWPDRAAFDTAPAVPYLPRTLRVPDRVDADVGRLSRAVGLLVERHAALRTGFQPAGDDLCQVVAATGTLPVRLLAVPPSRADPDGARAATELAAELAADPVDHRDEFALRVGLVRCGDRIRQVALAFSHAVVDFHAAEILLRDLRLAVLRGAVPGPAGWQPADVAADEARHGGPRSQRAARHWLAQFERLPAEMFPAGVGAGSHDPVGAGPRHRVARLVSGAVDLAARAVAARYGVSTATVLLAAIALAVADRAGTDGCGLVTMSSNRFRVHHRTAVASLNQIGLCHLDLTGRRRLTDLLGPTWQAALAAYRHAYYDPATLAAAFAARGHHLASALAPHCYVNDLRLPRESGPAPVADRAALWAATDRSVLTWLPAPDRFAWRCRWQVMDDPGGAALVVTADTGYLPPGDVEDLLVTVEASLVRAAGG
ncbi:MULTISPECIES: condensation domain-containing protein [unclassified Solwaraspora]|uniref:condensation domain-containing protein n=1 Tax=unclassified Solwaraspora TaxID=2627926 RepID=UPI00259B223A|nr:condensation domain-containing protein [Solwaraspora sp. WMMA2056]WJK43098.1 condensation domain-containing protein [Solwaraspora sp. WMMA2056]